MEYWIRRKKWGIFWWFFYWDQNNRLVFRFFFFCEFAKRWSTMMLLYQNNRMIAHEVEIGMRGEDIKTN
jgi:hypothetical protein